MARKKSICKLLKKITKNSNEALLLKFNQKEVKKNIKYRLITIKIRG